MDTGNTQCMGLPQECLEVWELYNSIAKEIADKHACGMCHTYLQQDVIMAQNHSCLDLLVSMQAKTVSPMHTISLLTPHPDQR